MSASDLRDELLEPERYELRADPLWSFELDRREVLKALGGGLVVLLLVDEPLLPQEAPPRRRRGGQEATPREIGAWLHVGEDGKVSVFTGKAEVGQDIRTSLAQAVADELMVPLEAVELVMADTSRVPYDRGTFGSRTTPTMSPWLRQVAATARERLVAMASEKLGIAADALRVEGGAVHDPESGQRLGFGEIAKGQRLTAVVSAERPTRPATAWKVAGAPARSVNGRAIVTGAHHYASDIAAELHGCVLRPEMLGAVLESVDTQAAEAMEGVFVVRDGDFVGVVAKTAHRAAQALAAIRARWKPPTRPLHTHEEIFDLIYRNSEDPAEGDAGGRGGRGARRSGSIEAGRAAAEIEISSTYLTAYLAHAPLETRAAVAEWEDDRLTVWTGTQRPFGVRSELARAFGLAEDRVRVIVPDTGSAYGGKHTGECAVEAARLARTVRRRVKVVWSREEELSWAYFRPAAMIEVSSGARKDGGLTLWSFHNYNSGSAGIRMPYEVPNLDVRFLESTPLLRQGSYRALAATANNFARESHLDELALELGRDPLELRLRNLEDGRLKDVLVAAAGRFGWEERARAEGRGFGLACGTEKGSYVACCAEVQASGRALEIRRLLTVFECGAIVNPDNLRSQVEGAVIMGLGGALFEGVQVSQGRIANASFAGYRVPRFSDVPPLETFLLDRKDLPSAGAGETPIIGVAPALANAIAAATGKRLRSLPLVPNGLPG